VKTRHYNTIIEGGEVCKLWWQELCWRER